ncbi:hypothetical protein [Butyrivibrio proteoclasticus]|uniref:hypothetical protein n=1 Tax=Butyrivibrio proteoclasticus TaxID=43305 RepID=UPI000945615C|nr:hypothetical protein [Butyrivibrio proteoclasticus]
MQSETYIPRTFGKPVPRTYDALLINGHYKDPRAVNERIKSIVSASLIVISIALPVLLIN